MFLESGRAEVVLTAMAAPFRLWLQPRLDDGRYFGWVAQAEDIAVGGLGMMVIDWPPHPSHPTQAVRGYILNVFVEPAHRGQGIAGKLMQIASAEAARRGIRHMVLHATTMGRPIYEKLGWRQTVEMSITLSTDNGA